MLVDESVGAVAPALQLLDGVGLSYLVLITRADERTPSEMQQLREQVQVCCRKGRQQHIHELPAVGLDGHQKLKFIRDMERSA